MIFLDLETLPHSSVTFESCLRDAKAPSNIKDPVKIEAARREKAQETLDRASLDALTGRVLCIGYAIDMQDEPTCLYAEQESQEPDIIQNFFDQVTHKEHYGYLDDSGSYQVLKRTVVGFNVCGFDLPFLARRAATHGIRIPTGFPIPKTPNHLAQAVDLMLVWCGKEKYVSFERLARHFGLNAKHDLDGSKIHWAYLNGEHDRIQRYNLEDVTLEREMYIRMRNANLC